MAVFASWNVHAWVGRDGLRDPQRCLDVVARLGADVVGLQEVEGHDWEERAQDLGYEVVWGPTIGADYGNAILSRAPVARVERLDLSVALREPRAALDVSLALRGRHRVVCCHLGLRAAERRRQVAHLRAALARGPEPDGLVLLGDFNDWTPGARQLAPLRDRVGPFSRLRTFPSGRPALALDRMAWRPRPAGARLDVLRGPEARAASDHLPLRLALPD